MTGMSQNFRLSSKKDQMSFKNSIGKRVKNEVNRAQFVFVELLFLPLQFALFYRTGNCP
jgi:hypothetical protein